MFQVYIIIVFNIRLEHGLSSEVYILESTKKKKHRYIKYDSYPNYSLMLREINSVKRGRIQSYLD